MESKTAMALLETQSVNQSAPTTALSLPTRISGRMSRSTSSTDSVPPRDSGTLACLSTRCRTSPWPCEIRRPIRCCPSSTRRRRPSTQTPARSRGGPSPGTSSLLIDFRSNRFPTFSLAMLPAIRFGSGGGHGCGEDRAEGGAGGADRRAGGRRKLRRPNAVRSFCALQVAAETAGLRSETSLESVGRYAFGVGPLTNKVEVRGRRRNESREARQHQKPARHGIKSGSRRLSRRR